MKFDINCCFYILNYRYFFSEINFLNIELAFMKTVITSFIFYTLLEKMSINSIVTRDIIRPLEELLIFELVIFSLHYNL